MDVGRIEEMLVDTGATIAAMRGGACGWSCELRSECPTRVLRAPTLDGLMRAIATALGELAAAQAADDAEDDDPELCDARSRYADELRDRDRDFPPDGWETRTSAELFGDLADEERAERERGELSEWPL